MSVPVILLPTRRKFLRTTVGTTALTALGGIGRPYLSRAADRPVISHGLQSGDVSNSSGVVWARADRPARMLVEWSTTESFKSVHHAGFVDALPETDCTANMLLENLPAGKHIFYRIRFEDFSSPTISRGGMRTYATMLRHRPDFFIHSGDNIYADVPIASEQKMPNGEIWRNIVRSSPRKRGPS